MDAIARQEDSKAAGTVCVVVRKAVSRIDIRDYWRAPDEPSNVNAA